ncbi:MAG TPA: hypothetical protein VD738_04510 [Nitrospira sp.]|jgi:hypothetical protein|nr:hypothetical protein [Nitrospira sp.]
MDETVESRRTVPAAPTDTAAAEARKLGLALLIGSNLFRNTSGVIKIQGKEQIVLESRPEQGLLLLTMDLYGEGGTHVAHVRRNVLALNQSGQYAVEAHHAQSEVSGDFPWVRLVDRRSGESVLEARIAAEHRVQIAAGRFYSHTGMLIEITPNFCRIGASTTLFGDIVESRGGMVVLGSDPSRPSPARP